MGAAWAGRTQGCGQAGACVQKRKRVAGVPAGSAACTSLHLLKPHFLGSKERLRIEPALEGCYEHVLKDDACKVRSTEFEHNKDAMNGHCYDNCWGYCWSQRWERPAQGRAVPSSGAGKVFPGNSCFVLNCEEPVRYNPTEGVGTEVGFTW